VVGYGAIAGGLVVGLVTQLSTPLRLQRAQDGVWALAVLILVLLVGHRASWGAARGWAEPWT
jgi:branched-subunit amino acid ABC-type transport system permease component